jgi:hypothetical protein
MIIDVIIAVIFFAIGYEVKASLVLAKILNVEETASAETKAFAARVKAIL